MINDITANEFLGAIALLLKHYPSFAKLSTVELMYMFYDADMSPSIKRLVEMLEEMRDYPVLTPMDYGIDWNRWV